MENKDTLKKIPYTTIDNISPIGLKILKYCVYRPLSVHLAYEP